MHYLVFTGHRIDTPDRETPLFPARVEPQVKCRIHDALHRVFNRAYKQHLRGISSGANGGDILFLEACVELGISAEIYLALEAAQFCSASVADAGMEWERRFEKLCNIFPVHILTADPLSDVNVWQRTNDWMLETALSDKGADVTIIALWDGDAGDGAGGTRDMVDRADLAGAKIVQLDPTTLL